MPNPLRIVLILTFCLTPALHADPDSALTDYIHAPDDSFSITERQRRDLPGAEVVELTMTSQTWHTIPWRHQLYVIRPSVMKHPKRMLLVVAGSRWRDHYDQPPRPDQPIPRRAAMFAFAAGQIGSPIAVLLHVPFQPMFDGKVEDEIIAHTFDRYLETGDESWPLLFPMVKSTVRAMDALETFAKDEWQTDIEGFTVTGGSKRGWTTWLTAAVDPRVKAIAPMVIDMLNMREQMNYQIDAWGAFSESISEYTELKIQDRMDTDRGKALAAMVDPYAYRNRLTMPKLIMLGTNDPFWPVDAMRHYWDDLPGPKFVTYVPNAGHDLGKNVPRILGTLAAIHHHACGVLELPQLEHRYTTTDEALSLTLTADHPPAGVTVWTAHSPNRDFRKATWTAHAVEPQDDRYQYDLPLPEAGHAAIFAEAAFDNAGLRYHLAAPLKLTGVN